MFDKSFAFLKSLSQNNNREWYHANKSLYNDAKEEFEHVTELLLHETTAFDKGLAGLTPGDCIFRIFRDVRFSPDKTPYKTNFGTFLTRGGKKAGFAGYYLHVEPGASFIAGGIYMPPSHILRAVRNDIFEHIDEYKMIINAPGIANNFGELSGDKLKNPPKGFPGDFPDIDLLKFKSYGFSKMKTDKEMTDDSILQEIVTGFRHLHPFVRFLNEAIASAG
ncbi:MAG: DUF2461 domain-containing protein [Bacteroidales bacterium]|jgi:uncharacterized protein (TIGR02453 family)